MLEAIRVPTLAIGAIGVMCLLHSAPTFAAVACDVKSIQATVPADTTITAAVRLDKPVAHCKIDGYVTATNPGPNRDYFRLQLPDKQLWKNRFYFIGMGGAAGYVPTDSQIPAGNPMVKGFAVAGTDTGHEGAILDWRFLNDRVKTLDHRDRGAHLTTVAAQAITRAYYGVTKMYRYESGCSGGGRMGGEAISRHPEDYDGVLLGEMSGISNNKTIEFSNYKFIHVSQVMNREPGAWLSPAKLKMVDKKVTAACDASDGAIDGIVWDHRACKFDFASLKCKSGDGPDCLTQPEITSIQQILDGPRGPDGKRFTVGWPITNMSTWASFIGSEPPPWSKNPSPANMSKSSAGYIIAYTRGSGFFGPDFDPLTFNLKDPKSIDTWERLSRAQQFQGSPNPTPFEKTGGKLILFGGVSSPCCSNVEMEEWFDKYAKQFGREQTQKFMALYELPGIGHCMGGPGPQDGADVVLQALVDWVEADVQPAALVAHRGADRTKFMFAADADVPAIPLELTGNKPVPQVPTSGPSRDFLLCPYPQRSVFKGGVANPDKLDVNEAANWSCRASPH
jgi:feruloyl esterase